ncbi:hypothetical protein LRX75_03170 [Rhizobium sp. DKSPLA3]|uniref:Uncharacterized protein n=1 Tax=Rhizobium quercicola TaxID=2901226 RepID=A0A9X1NMV8_9HYPH|nr:hypothetical protein [Rhizobium quercicola]MCD7108037.1 hypothetical protein [Rhizobium quercicola]
MTIRFLKTKAVLSGNCTVEEAEDLVQWLVNHPKAEVNMREVTHLHTASLQAIAAAGNRISALPDDPFCAQALQRLGRA